jgi:hypothetical protein
MDTAQRGMGLDWPTSLELIRRSLDAAKDVPGALVASGCGTDHLVPENVKTVNDVIAGYEEQMAAIEKLGGKLIVMASRALARVAKSPADYETRLRPHPVAGEAARGAALAGRHVRPGAGRLLGQQGTLKAAMDTALGIIAAHADKVDGIKISLLDKDKEIAMRRRLPATGAADGSGVRMYTGDDFNYAELIAGDGFGRDAVHGQERRAAGHLRRHRPGCQRGAGRAGPGQHGKVPRDPRPHRAAVAPHLRGAHALYKTGVVFMAWLNGHQKHFTMVGGQQSTRSLQHFAELFRLADAANLLEQPDLATKRMKTLLALHGV